MSLFEKHIYVTVFVCNSAGLYLPLFLFSLFSVQQVINER